MFARQLQSGVRVFGRCGRLRDTRGRDRRCIVRSSEVPAGRFGGVEELGLLRFEGCSPRRQLLALARAALLIELRAVKLLAMLSQGALTLLQIRAGTTQSRADFLLVSRVRSKRFIGGTQRGLELRELIGRALQLSAHPAGDRIAFATLLFRPLAAGRRVAQPLLGDRDLAPKLLGALALIRNEPGELGTACFGGGTFGQGCVARRLRVPQALLFGRDFYAQGRDTALETHQLAAPRGHLARSVRDFERKSAGHQLGVALRPLSLPRQRPNLALHFGDEIVDARHVGRCFLEPPLRASLAVTVESDSGRFLEQLPTLIRFIGQQRIHHLSFDHDTGIGA